METTKDLQVRKQGGNQYLVTCLSCHTAKVIDLDGFTIMSDKDRAELASARCEMDDSMSPDIALDSDGDDLHFLAAVKHAANYSGFDAKKYILENKA